MTWTEGEFEPGDLNNAWKPFGPMTLGNHNEVNESVGSNYDDDDEDIPVVLPDNIAGINLTTPFSSPVAATGYGGVDTVYFDPAIAIGYGFQSNNGNRFKYFEMPEPLPQGDDEFLIVHNHVGYPLTAGIGGGIDFTTIDPSGVDSFLLLNIDEAETIDPTGEGTPFIFGLTFVDEGVADFSTFPLTYIAGLYGTTGDCVGSTAPTSVEADQMESDSQVLVFPEQENFTLPADVSVDASSAGTYDEDTDLTSAIVPGGSVVHVYGVHFDPEGSATVSGSINFGGDILGVIVTSSGLDGTDGELGSTTTVYPTGTIDRGLELTGKAGGDSFTISADLKTLTINELSADIDVDQLRVITSLPPVMGDSNDDGELNNLDIAAFVLALTNTKAYQAMFPDVDPDVQLDMDGSGVFDNLDIAGFVAALTGG